MLRLLFLLAVAAGILSACGQSGPLYLPGNPSEIRAQPPAEEPEQEDDGEQG